MAGNVAGGEADATGSGLAAGETAERWARGLRPGAARDCHGRMPIRWFFALNESSPSFWEYANLVQVAVYSAKTRTGLAPVCLYDGEENLLTGWLRAVGVPIVPCRTFLQELVPDLAPIPRGAYLRLEIPAVCAAQGWGDRFVLYTDCDVVFRRDPEPLLAGLRPRYFAAAPETDRTDFARFNSGAMWINVPAFAAERAALEATVRAHLQEAISPPYDQAALQRHFAGRVDPLPLELNWKPYWGACDDATIVHFHGPKPAQKHHVLNRRVPEHVARLATPAYFAACAEWDELLIRALGEYPWPDDISRGPDVAEGFGDTAAEVVAGLAPLEPPRPEAGMPAVRWGLAPRTVLAVESRDGERLRLEGVAQAAVPEQAAIVRVDGVEVGRVAFARLHDPYAFAFDLPPGSGRREVEIAYARVFVPGGADTRELGVLYRALRVRRV